MYALILSVLCFVGGLVQCEVPDQQSRMRDLIIFLDDNVETNSNKAGAAISDFSNALMAESAPILISATIMRTFTDLRREWTLLSQVAGSSEHKTAQLLDDINACINHWHEILRDSGDELQIRS